MSKIENGSGVRNAPPLKAGDGPAAAITPAERLALRADGVKTSGAPVPTEAERQQAALEAAKAAIAAGKPGAVAVAGDRPPPAPPPKDPPGPGLAQRLWTGAKAGPAKVMAALGRGLYRIYESDHPLAAVGRGAARLVPFACAIAVAHDTLDALKTFDNPSVPLWKKALVGVKATAGIATVGAATLLAVTGAAAFLPWALGAGAIALGADLAISRIRTGHW